MTTAKKAAMLQEWIKYLSDCDFSRRATRQFVQEQKGLTRSERSWLLRMLRYLRA